MADQYTPVPEVPRPPSRSLLVGVVAALLATVVCGALGVGVLAYQTGMLPFLNPIAGAPPPPAEPAPLAPARPIRPVDLHEPFDTPSPLWEQSRSVLVGGAYEIAVDLPGTTTYGLYLGNPRVQDFDMAVDMRQEAGDLNSEYGIRFRQEGVTSYTMCSISSTGYYRLIQVTGGNYNQIVPWTYSPAIRTGLGAVNRMRVVASGTDLSCSVNGRELVRRVDPQVRTGQLTLGLATFDQGGLVVRFDDIEGEITAPFTMSLDEDFNQPELSEWAIGGGQFNGGGYELFAGPGGLLIWADPLPAGSHAVEDFDAEVSVTWVDSQGDDSGYGLIFRNGGNFDFYTFTILRDGSVQLNRSDQNNALQILPPGSIVIESGRYNTLRIEERGEQIRLFVDGQVIAEFEDGWRTGGEVGMLVRTGLTGIARARFDNFRLAEVQP